MKIDGTETIRAPRDFVWRAFLDPEVLKRVLPGCEKLERESENVYCAEFKLGLAAVRGEYRGRVEILDAQPSERFRMKLEGNGTGGFVKGDGTVSIAEGTDGSSVIHYSGDVQVGGVIASVGQRLLAGAANQVVGQFFAALAKILQAP